jgi:hypothetical protein
MIKIRIIEIINWFHNNYKDKIVHIHIINGETIEECFKKVYGLRKKRKI